MSQLFFMNFKRDTEFVYDSSEEEESEKEEREDKLEKEEKKEKKEEEEGEEESEKEEINNKMNLELGSIASSKTSSLIKNNSSISDNYSENSYSSQIDNKSSIVEEKFDEEFNKFLSHIIDKDKIINTILISRNVSFLKKVNGKIINFNISKNKKICYFALYSKRAKHIFDSFKDENEIKPLILQKIKLNKNEYLNFRKQINNNNVFIVNPNLLYKLLSIGFVKISDFGVMIYEECQLCNTNHPYNLIMQEFYFYYIINNIKIDLPSIIGYASSPFKDKNIIKNSKKCGEFLKNISENLNCHIIFDSSSFEHKSKNEGKNIELIKVENYLKEKNKVMGINAILMKYFFEDMYNVCLKDYIKMNGETEELKGEKKEEIRQKYLKNVEIKFISEDFIKYTKLESAERSLHFLPHKSLFFKVFEDMQRHLINIIQNVDLEEIHYFFEKYKNLYENNYKKLKEDNDNDKYLQKQYRKMIIIFESCEKAFKKLIDVNIKYETDKINKFTNKLNHIYTKNKRSKTLIFVPNRKIASILHNYLNRNKNENIFKNKSKFIVGNNVKREENALLSLATRTSPFEAKERIKEFNENKINILICSPSTIEYLDTIESTHIILFDDFLNHHNNYKKIEAKSQVCNAELIILKEDTSKESAAEKEQKDIEISRLKELFFEGEKMKTIKDFRDKNFIINKNKNSDKMLYYYISETEAKISLKNCMILFNEINNAYISKGFKIEIEKNSKKTENKEKPFFCDASFKYGNESTRFVSNLYPDIQSAENECYMKYIIYLHQKRLIDNNLQLLF